MIHKSSFSRGTFLSVTLAFALCVAFTEGSLANDGVHAVKVDPSVSWGSWEGWGCSLCWWGKIFGDRNDLADVLYTTNTVSIGKDTLPGLGLNIVRYNAGACSWNKVDGAAMAVSSTILPFRQIEGFWLDGKSTDPTSASWNWNVDANQRAMMLKARDRGANRFELFSNSPMWWMLSNRNPSGSADGKSDNLPAQNIPLHAVYLATVAKHAKDHWGITFTSVEPLNESISNWWTANCKQEGCHFSLKAQEELLSALRRELDARGLQDVPVAASDENTYDEAVKTWNSFDATTRQSIAQINVHGYQFGKGHRDLVRKAATTDGKRLWNSEYGEKDPTGLGLARNLNLDFHQLHPSAWCYWQAIDGGQGGGWGLFGGDLTTKTIDHANPKYFVLAQYSRHIRPGMTLIDSGDPSTVAAYDAKEHKLVLVTFNDGPARAFTYDLSRFTEAAGPVSRWITEPKGTTRYESHDEPPIDHGSFTSQLSAESVTTFEVTHVTAR